VADDSMTHLESEAFEEGYAAHSEGWVGSNNPHNADSMLYRAWLKGWYQAAIDEQNTAMDDIENEDAECADHV
jgi:hypothetical protein